MNTLLKALGGIALGFALISGIAWAADRVAKFPSVSVSETNYSHEAQFTNKLVVFGSASGTSYLGGAGVMITNWLALSATTNQLTDDGTQLLWNGLPIGGTTTNVFSFIITTNLQVLEITEVNNTFVTNLTVYEIATFATNITIQQFIEIKGNSTVIFTNNSYVTTNTFLFVNEEGKVVSISANSPGFDFVGTNFVLDIEAGQDIDFSTNGTTITILLEPELEIQGATVTNNIGALLSVGDTTFVDVSRGSQTNSVSGALTFAHATNGVHGSQVTHLRQFLNSSGSDQTLSFPIADGRVDGWLTNHLTGAIPPAITNNTTVFMLLRCNGPTDTLARQTNIMVLGFEYY